jgi:pilus assembly protein Flp/PilA
MTEVQKLPIEQQGDEVARKRRRKRGQGLVEYALILVLVAVVVIVILAVLGPVISNVYREVVCTLNQGECPEDGGGSCTSEEVHFSSHCSGSSLVMSATTSCSGATLSMSPIPLGTVSNGCNASGTAISSSVSSQAPFTITSHHSDGSTETYFPINPSP